VAQVEVAYPQHREQLQAALDTIDRLGLFYCVDWSKHNVPPLPGEHDG